jgi:glycosyltransferase involved in cell wall biosynthesis
MKVHLWSPEITAFGYGIAAFSRAMTVGLLELGHDLRLLAKMDAPGTWAGCPLWGAGNVPSSCRTPVFAGVALASCAMYRPDHVISTHLNFGPAALWAKRAFGTPFTLVAHGIDVHDGLSAARQAALRTADRVIAVSAWTRARVLGLGGIEPSRVAVVPNTVDADRFCVSPRPEGLAKRYGLQPGERVVLSVARLSAADGYKGHDRVILALPRIRESCGPVRFLLAGRGDDRPRLEALARDAGVKDAVTFTGFLPDSELADHYRLADVFAMPSRGEGFGVVFLEAMSCGTPVLAGNRDGSVDALDGGRLGCLVDPDATSAVEAGIVALLKKEGPAMWFDRHALHSATSARFGPDAFRETLRRALAS